jgi:hemoglobin
MTKPMLAHRPEVQQLIDQGMQNADRQASVPQRAKLLHETIETVRNRLKPAASPTTPDPSKGDKAPAVLASPPPLLPATLPPDPTMTAPPPAPQSVTPASAPPTAAGPAKRSLWDRLGGEANVAKVVELFVNLSLEDPSINFSRNGTVVFNEAKEKELKQRLVGFISELAGGAVPYTGKGMAEAHQEMKIQGKEFDAFVKSLGFALQQNGVKPADIEELLEKVRATRKEVVTAPGG